MVAPVFIIGCPRSGTTIMLDVMGAHEDLAWVSNLVNHYPARTSLALFSRIHDLPFLRIRSYLLAKRNRFIPRPVEPWNFWESYLVNFRWKRGGAVPPRRRTAADISAEEISRIRRAIASLCKFQGKTGFISKYTDFPRIAFLSQAFPEARFIHIVRDGRAVAHSYLQKIDSGRFNTWNEKDWWISGWPSQWREEFEAKHNTPLAFVAYQWKFFLQEIWADAAQLDDERYLEINYRDLTSAPAEQFERMFRFYGLPMSRRVLAYLAETPLKNMNFKWREAFGDEELAVLKKIFVEPELLAVMDPAVPDLEDGHHHHSGQSEGDRE